VVKKEMENQLETCHLISLAYEIPVTVHDIMVFAVSISHYGTYKCLLKFMVWFIKKNPTRCNHVPKFYYSIFIRSSTCFGQHTAHYQRHKIAMAASGFSYVEGCWTCSWSGTLLCLTTSTDYMSNNLSCMKN